MARKTDLPTPSPRAALNEHGHEVPHPKPLSIPSGFKRPESLAEQVQRLVRHQVSEEAQRAGFETFEESEDFELPDDPEDPTTPYEEFFDPVLGRGITADEFRRNEPIYRERYLKAEQAAYEAMELSDALRRRVPLEREALDPQPSPPEGSQIAAPRGDNPPKRASS